MGKGWVDLILFSQLPTYQMRAGDTLYSVARRNGITPMDLLAVNPNISAHSARAGTVVRIPYVGMTTRMAKATMPPAGTPESAPQGSEAPDYEEQEYEEQEEESSDAETAEDRSAAQPQLPALPKALDQLESNAEDIIDYIDNKDWTRAQAAVDAMEQNLAELEPSFRAANVPQSIVNGIRMRITTLEAQVEAKNAYGAKVQANAITRFIPDIYDHYRVAVPTDLGRLDYLGREVLLNVEKGDWTSARNNAAEVQRVWSRLEPTLNATAERSAADFESTVNALSGHARNMDGTATARDANALLDKVDVLEQAYTG